jgi:hypothetical protein
MDLVITKEILEMDLDLRKKIDVICSFTKTKPKYQCGSIRKVNKTNLVYVEPHKIFIDNIVLLIFNNSDYVYIGNLNNKIPLSNLKSYIQNYTHK